MIALVRVVTAVSLVAPLWVALWVALAPTAVAQRAGSQAEKAKLEREEERALAAFAKLTPAEQRDLCDYFELEVSQLDNFQLSLVRFVLKNQDRDPGLWPPVEEAPVFDPHEHAPNQPIARHALDPESETAREFKAKVFAAIPVRRLTSAYFYDYATRELRRSGDVKDPARIIKNALAGYPPDVDLCEALVERALDDGTQQKSLAAFGHAYTDRDGNVYPGVTLYDAWTAQIEIEMPDVDTLGILHSVVGDYKTWVAPVSEQKGLYDKLGELYLDAHHHRSLRHALARAYVVGSAVMRDHYENNLDNFHALWDANQSTPATLFAKLPAAAKWNDFLAGWAKTCKSKPAMLKSGTKRRFELDQNAAAVRALVLAALKEFGAFERLDKKMTGPVKPGSGKDN